MSELSNIKNQLLTERVRDKLQHYILENKYEVGMKLPNEFDLAYQFNVSRSTIREAEKMLVSKGILQVKRGSGAYVASLMEKDSDPLGLGEIKDKSRIALDLLEVRMMIEPKMAELAALNRTDEELEELTRLCKEVNTLIKQGKYYLDADFNYHNYIARCSHNRIAEQLMPIIDTAVVMLSSVTKQTLLKVTVETHEQILDCIRERDRTGACNAMMMHLNYNREVIRMEAKEKSGKL